MQNDVLKNNIAPWQEKGRWYHGKVDLTNIYSFIINETDEYLIQKTSIGAATGCLLLVGSTNKIHILDSHFRLSNYTRTADSGVTVIRYFYSNGREGIFIAPSGATTGTVDFWVFIVEDE